MSENLQIVRVVTSAWKDKSGLNIRKSIRWMRRSSIGHNVLEEDVDMVGADEAASKILNLFDVEDGLYSVVMVNISKDWESGHVDDWDYRLIPYSREPVTEAAK